MVSMMVDMTSGIRRYVRAHPTTTGIFLGPTCTVELRAPDMPTVPALAYRRCEYARGTLHATPADSFTTLYRERLDRRFMVCYTGHTLYRMCRCFTGFTYMKEVTVETKPLLTVVKQDEDNINARWRQFFTLWYEQFGTASVKLHQIAPLAKEAGFDLIIPRSTRTIEADGALPSFTRFGMILKRKHRDVHAGLRLVSDRIEMGWSKKTTGTTYHLEPKDFPRNDLSGAIDAHLGESEE